MKLKKKIPVIDQTDKLGFWGEKFGGNFCAETLKKPIEDLEILFNKLKDNRSFIKLAFECLKKDGIIIFSTINKSFLSYFTTIFLAEKVIYKELPK